MSPRTRSRVQTGVAGGIPLPEGLDTASLRGMTKRVTPHLMRGPEGVADRYSLDSRGPGGTAIGGVPGAAGIKKEPEGCLLLTSFRLSLL